MVAAEASTLRPQKEVRLVCWRLEAGGHLIMIYCMIPVVPGLENLYFSWSSAIVAEMWAVITCLEGARDGGFKQLHSQIDSAVTVEMLQDAVCASIP